jgi:phosphatidylglycerol lysyltransferase
MPVHLSSRRARRLAAGLLALAGLADVLLPAFSQHGPLGWDTVPSYGWPRFLLTAMGALCLGLVPGVSRGRREARWAAAAALGSSMMVGSAAETDVAAFLPSAVAAGGLLLLGRMPGRADSRLTGRAFRDFVLAELAVLLYATIGLYALVPDFREATTLSVALREGIKLAVLLPSSALQPATDHGAWFLESIRWLSALAVGVSALRWLAPGLSEDRAPDDALRARAVLDRWGANALAPFHLQPDKHWAFAPDGEAFVGYALAGTSAVALGGPVGAPASRGAAITAFLTTCERQGWSPAFHLVDEAEAATLTAGGLRTVKIGEEAVIDLETFSLAGKSMKTIRNTLSRAARDGMRTEILLPPLEPRLLDELAVVSDSWLQSSGHRERGFSVGRFDRHHIAAHPVVVVRAADDRAVAFANLEPSFAGTTGNFDLMRRLPDAPQGTMELLFMALMEHFRGAGLSTMSLGLAPLTGIEGVGPLPGLLRAARERTSFLNFSGLADFKSKWRPEWQPRYFAYAAVAELPRVAAATARASERPGRGPTTDRVAGLARRFAGTLTLGGTIVWLMAASAGDPGYHRALALRFAVSWPALTRLELWRIPLSSIVQHHAGWVPSVLVLLVGLAFAEARLGTRRILFVYIACTAISTVPVLASLHLFGAVPPSAGRHASAASLGSSAGLYGVLAAAIASLTPSRLRTGAGVGLATTLLVAGVFHPGLHPWQHAVAAVVGATIVLGLPAISTATGRARVRTLRAR